MVEFERFSTYEATFQPKRLETLRPEAQPFVGQRLRFDTAWLIDEDDGGPYVGQWALTLHDRTAPLGWVPQEDLVDVVAIETPDHSGLGGRIIEIRAGTHPPGTEQIRVWNDSLREHPVNLD